jgi:hypothetical protein
MKYTLDGVTADGSPITYTATKPVTYLAGSSLFTYPANNYLVLSFTP